LTFKHKKRLFVIQFQIIENLNHLLGLGAFEGEVLNNGHGVAIGLVAEGAAAGETFDLDVELEAIVAGLGSKDAATTDEDGALQIARAGAAGAFLTFEFAGAVGVLAALFGLVGTLAVVGQVLFDIEVDGVVVGLDGEDRILEVDGSTGFVSVDVINFKLHVLLTPSFKFDNRTLGAGHRAFDQHEVFLGDDFDHLEVLDLDAVVAHLTSHAHAFEDARGVGGCTDRTRGAQTVMLTVGLVADTAEAVTGDYALEAFTLGGADNVDKLALLEDLDGEHFTVFLLVAFLEAGELSEVAFGGGVGFGEVATHSLGGVLFALFTKGELDSLIAIFLNGSDLCNDTRTSFNHCARNLLSVGIKKTGHSDFLSD